MLCPCVLGQTNWSIEGSIPTYGEYNFPNPAALTNPMPYAVFVPPPPPAGAPGNLPFPVLIPGFGGSSVDNDGNPLTGGSKIPAMFHSDGMTVEITDFTGLYVSSYPAGAGILLPATISGVAHDNANEITWLTDGMMCIGVGLPPAPGVVPPVIFPPFPLPLPAGVPADGLGWDPITGTLWFCDLQGLITNCTTAGAPLVTFPAVGLAVPLFGLAVNTTNGNVQVTDGFMVAEYLPGGGLAPPGAFYLWANPYPITPWAAPVGGLGFSLRPQRYGAGFSPSGGPPPAIGTVGGFAYAGNPTFTIMETGAMPNTQAKLVVGFKPAIPGLPLGGSGATLWVFPIWQIIPLGPVPASGTVAITVPLPPPPFPGGPPVGGPIFLQFVNVISNIPFKYEMSDALSFTIGQI